MMRYCRCVMLIAMSMILSACGFHLRNNANVPSSLQPVYFEAEHPNSALSLQLRRMLLALQIRLVPQQHLAHYTLRTQNDVFTTTTSNAVNTSLPTTIDNTLSVTLVIQDNYTHKTVASHTFSASQSLLLNANQVYTPDTNSVLKQTLNNQIQTTVFYWLTSQQLNDTLTHENHARTITQHALKK